MICEEDLFIHRFAFLLLQSLRAPVALGYMYPFDRACGLSESDILSTHELSTDRMSSSLFSLIGRNWSCSVVCGTCVHQSPRKPVVDPTQMDVSMAYISILASAAKI